MLVLCALVVDEEEEGAGCERGMDVAKVLGCVGLGGAVSEIGPEPA